MKPASAVEAKIHPGLSVQAPRRLQPYYGCAGESANRRQSVRQAALDYIKLNKWQKQVVTGMLGKPF